MSIKSHMESALMELERGLSQQPDRTPQVFTWEDADYPCIPRTLETAIVIDPYGNAVDINLVIITRISHFTTITVDQDTITVDSDQITADGSGPDVVDSVGGIGIGRPVSGDLITYHGVDYRVIKVGVSPDRGHFTIHCADPNSNI